MPYLTCCFACTRKRFRWGFASPLGFGAERDFNVTVYEEGLYVGYRYFETFGKPVAFPFGHGLSYTTFTRECVRFENHGAEVEMDVRVTNTGSRPGKESVLLFAELPEGSSSSRAAALWTSPRPTPSRREPARRFT